MDLSTGVAATQSARLARLWWTPLAIAVAATALAVWAPGPTVATNDEPLWVIRSAQMREALHTGDLDRAIALNPLREDGPATQPGVTTMVLGAVGEDLVRVIDSPEAALSRGFLAPRSASVLRAGQVMVSVACGAALGLLTWLLSLAVGRLAATVAGALLAVEPFLLGHMGVLHTDAMMALFGACSVAAIAALLLDSNTPSRRRTIVLVGVAAVTGALALLTKLLAVVVLATGGAVVVGIAAVAVVRRWRRTGGAPWPALARIAAMAGAWAVATVLLALAGHPRMWVAPGDTWDRVWRSRDIASTEAPVFYRGQVGTSTDASFLWVTTLFRMSPWLLVAGLAAVAATGWWLLRPSPGSPRRAVLALWLTWPVLYIVAVSTQTKLYDRYALTLWVGAAVLVGLGVDAAWRSPRLTGGPRRVAVGAAAFVMAVAVAVAVTTAPYRTAYVDPLVGGQRRAERTIPLGWGEGIEVVGATIDDRHGPDGCGDVVIAASALRQIVLPCGGPTLGELEPDQHYYVIVTVSDRQRPRRDHAAAGLGPEAELVDVADIDGVAYAELWYVDPAR